MKIIVRHDSVTPLLRTIAQNLKDPEALPPPESVMGAVKSAAVDYFARALQTGRNLKR